MYINNLLDLNETIAKKLFDNLRYPWEALPKISDYLVELGKTYSKDSYDRIADDIWISKTATVASSASIEGPTIIGHFAEVRHCAYIRGNVIVGEKAI